MAGTESAAGAYELAYDEARRALEDQERVVNELRSRAGVLIAAAAITTSFFGGRTLAVDEVGVASWAAIVFFALLGATVLVVLWPRHDRVFKANRRQLRSLLAVFRGGAILLVLEVVAWVVALVERT
jgi:hypothetical protein